MALLRRPFFVHVIRHRAERRTIYLRSLWAGAARLMKTFEGSLSRRPISPRARAVMRCYTRRILCRSRSGAPLSSASAASDHSGMGALPRAGDIRHRAVRIVRRGRSCLGAITKTRWNSVGRVFDLRLARQLQARAVRHRRRPRSIIVVVPRPSACTAAGHRVVGAVLIGRRRLALALRFGRAVTCAFAVSPGRKRGRAGARRQTVRGPRRGRS